MAPDGDLTGSRLHTAAGYAALGLAVIPICPAYCTCGSPGKRPADPMAYRHMRGWQERRAPTREELDAWLATPSTWRMNIGCLCGPDCIGSDGLIGADADGDRGVADLSAHLGLPVGGLAAAVREYLATGVFALHLGTAAYLTPSGGMRVLWRSPAGADLRSVCGDRGHDGLALSWAGKQVVLPPSETTKGAYRWLPGHAPGESGITAAPAAVLAAMAPDAKQRARDAAKAAWNALPPEVRYTTPRVSLPAGVYPAATAETGPDRDGTLVAAWRLPYDLDVLRDGVPQGRRSEAVWRLEHAMLAAGWTAEQVVGALAGQPWVAAMRTDIVSWLTGDVARAIEKRGAGAVAPAQAGAPEVGVAEGYDRRDRAGTRLRDHDHERDLAVRRGLERILDCVGDLPYVARVQERLGAHCARLLETFSRCCTEAWGRRHALRGHEAHVAAGTAWVWGNLPCDGRGHEECAPYHAARELDERWGPALTHAYGIMPVSVIAMSAPGWGLAAARRAVVGLLRASRVQQALGLCAGYLIFDTGEAPGYTYHLVVPAHRTEGLSHVLLRGWRERVPCGWLRRVEDLPRRCTALEALVELRVRSEQALLLALGTGQLAPEHAAMLYATETGAVSDSAIGGQMHRMVMAPGMRQLAQDLRDGRCRLAAAVGDDTEGADDRADQGAQGSAGTAPQVEGIRDAPIPSTQRAETATLTGTGDAGVSAPRGGGPSEEAPPAPEAPDT